MAVGQSKGNTIFGGGPSGVKAQPRLPILRVIMKPATTELEALEQIVRESDDGTGRKLTPNQRKVSVERIENLRGLARARALKKTHP